MKGILSFSLVLGIASTALAQVEVYSSRELYNNADNNQNVDFSIEAANTQFGDQIILGFDDQDLQDGLAGATQPGSFFVAQLDNIFFQYFADVDTLATLRLYDNDGVEVPTNGTSATAPGTLLFEASFNLPSTPAGSLEVPLGGVEVGENLTWTIEFDTPFAGLPIYSPPTKGNGFTDFWSETGDGGAWELNAITGEDDASFAAIINGSPVLVPEPSTFALLGLGAVFFGFQAFRRKN